MRAWSAISYLFPGLHPEGYASPVSGWPRVLKPFAEETWRRDRAGELEEDEMFACDAQWAGIFDRFIWFTPLEYERRLQIAGAHGEPAHG